VWLPTEVLGTLNVQENAPAPLLITVVGNVVRAAASKFNDITCVGSKFDPVTVTVAPLGPLVGLNVMARAMTVKVFEYEFAPSEARTAYPPAEEEGTINEPENEPKLFVCRSKGEVATLALLKLNVIGEEAANPCPVIETEVP